MDFYRCFVCEISLTSQVEFEEHLKHISHLRSLCERKLLSPGHLDMLICIDSFHFRDQRCKISRNTKKTVHAVETDLTSVNFAGDGTHMESRRVLDDCSLPDVIAGESIQVLGAQRSEKENFDALSIVCLVCSQKLSNFNYLNDHLMKDSHGIAMYEKSRALKAFECTTCQQCFDDQKLIEHLIMDHFKIQRCVDFSSRRDTRRHFQCLLCEKQLRTPSEGHFSSERHLKKISEAPMENYFWCRDCDEVLDPINNINYHCTLLAHRLRVTALDFYSSLFLKKKKMKPKSHDTNLVYSNNANLVRPHETTVTSVLEQTSSEVFPSVRISDLSGYQSLSSTYPDSVQLSGPHLNESLNMGKTIETIETDLPNMNFENAHDGTLTDSLGQFVECSSHDQESTQIVHPRSSKDENFSALSITCLVCSEKFSSFNDFKSHPLKDPHKKAKCKNPEVDKAFECTACQQYFEDQKLIEHLIVNHFQIQRRVDFESRKDICGHFECLPCKKQLSVPSETHFSSKKHLKLLLDAPMENYFRCRDCDEVLDPINDAYHHLRLQAHQLRADALDFYSCFLDGKRKKRKPDSHDKNSHLTYSNDANLVRPNESVTSVSEQASSEIVRFHCTSDLPEIHLQSLNSRGSVQLSSYNESLDVEKAVHPIATDFVSINLKDDKDGTSTDSRRLLDVCSFADVQRSTQIVRSQNSQDFDALSIVCLACSEKLSTLKDLKDHLIEDSHGKAKYKTPEVGKAFECTTCQQYFDDRKLVEHLIFDHFKIQRRVTRHYFECLSCEMQLYTPSKGHFSSERHLKKLSKAPIEKFIRCKVCDEVFDTLKSTEYHRSLQAHRLRIRALELYDRLFVSKKKVKQNHDTSPHKSDLIYANLMRPNETVTSVSEQASSEDFHSLNAYDLISSIDLNQ